MRVRRFCQVIKYVLLLVLAGGLYGLAVERTGFGIPCIFHLVTGWQCPGCGMTHMCIALLHLDVRTAYGSHPVMFLLLPVFGVIFARYLIRYVNSGQRRLSRAENGIIYLCIALLLIYTVVRNLP